MPQSADKVLDHSKLFSEPEYKEMLANKKATFECGHTAETITQIGDWTKSWEYREQNLAREALTVNPAKACQPVGAVFAAQGYEGTLPFVHGSQGCVAYYRSHLSRHFKEPSAAVSSSMTEDAAVFGGLTNMVEGLANAYALYKPRMIAVSTTCMIQTPIRALPLRSFFSRAVSTQGGGEGVSRDSALDFVSRTVGAEDPQRPLSDDAIVVLAERAGLHIARRTVAKHRIWRPEAPPAVAISARPASVRITFPAKRLVSPTNVAKKAFFGRF